MTATVETTTVVFTTRSGAVVQIAKLTPAQLESVKKDSMFNVYQETTDNGDVLTIAKVAKVNKG